MILVSYWFKSSVELRKLYEGFAQDQQWSLGVGHVPGVGSGREVLCIRAQCSRVLGSLWSRICRVLVIGVKCVTYIIRRLQYLEILHFFHILFRVLGFISNSWLRVFKIIMPPWRAARGRTTKKNVEEPEVPNAPNVQPEEEVTNAEFHEAFRMLSQEVTNQVWK